MSKTLFRISFRRLPPVVTGIAAIVLVLRCCLPLLAAAPRQRVEVTTTDRIPFGAGGLIHVNGSAGQLSVEGWDEPAVEITMSRTLFPRDTPKEKDQAKQQLDGIRILTERLKANELAISTVLPVRKFPGSLRGKTTAALDYVIRVPRDSTLLIQHGGALTIHGVDSDIDAAARSGIFIQIPGAGPYFIDAKARVGDIYSDFAGQFHRTSLLGQNFTAQPSGPVHQIHLRVDVGPIDIQRLDPVSRMSAQPAIN